MLYLRFILNYLEDITYKPFYTNRHYQPFHVFSLWLKSVEVLDCLRCDTSVDDVFQDATYYIHKINTCIVKSTFDYEVIRRFYHPIQPRVVQFFVNFSEGTLFTWNDGENLVHEDEAAIRLANQAADQPFPRPGAPRRPTNPPGCEAQTRSHWLIIRWRLKVLRPAASRARSRTTSTAAATSEFPGCQPARHC